MKKSKQEIEEIRKAWVAANPDKIKAMSQSYYLRKKNDPEYIKKKRERYLAKAEKISEENKKKRAEYRLLHPIVRVTEEQKKANEKAWRLANREKLNADAKKWREENKEHYVQYHKVYNKEWYAENKEERVKQLREYSKAHPKENVIRTQRYVQRFPEKVKDYNKKFNQTLVGKYRYTLERSKKWKTEPITIEEFRDIVLLPCVYCGEQEKNRGIDRIDNAKGYTRKNSAPCCAMCNYMKKNHSVSNFLTHIRKIYMNNK